MTVRHRTLWAHMQAAGEAAARASDIPSQQRKLRKVQHRCAPLRWRSEAQSALSGLWL